MGKQRVFLKYGIYRPLVWGNVVYGFPVKINGALIGIFESADNS